MVKEVMVKEFKEYGQVAQKVLLLLGAGLALGLSASPTNYFRILKAVGKEWKDINKRALHRAIKKLYESKLIDTSFDNKGLVILKLNDKGKKKVLKYRLSEIKVPKMKKWDGNWRIVLFDIPEVNKRERDALRFHLKKMEFFEYQKSVLVHPFDCRDELDFLIEFYNIRPYVRFMVAKFLDNEFHLKKHFNLR